MNWPLESIPSALRPAVEERLARLDEQGGLADVPHEPGAADALPLVWACSDFVADACLRDRELLPWLFAARRLSEPQELADLERDLESAVVASSTDDAAFMDALRRFRRRHLARIAWRDLAGLADVDTVLRELSLLADVCIRAACRYADTAMADRHGAPQGSDGARLELLVLAMGKLGGGELNFSSDIDLVFAFPEHGETGGARPLEHEEYFARLGRRVAQLLGSVTAEGFVYRVDLRLRPFGDSGPAIVSFDALEDYLQQHGRDWERYAYVKARPVHGAESFDELYRNVLRPFVYRRYLDFSVFESLREMKDLIAREVERRELRDNVKLGPGGIREIEFIVQAFQLIRGGGKPALQTRSLLQALPLLAGHKLLSPEAVVELGESYRFLRRVENRLQQRNDEQTHDLPRDETGRARLALAMGAADWPALAAELERHRRRVSGHFRTLIFGPAEPGADDGLDRALETLLEPEIDDARRLELLQKARIGAADAVLAQLNVLRESAYYRRLDETGRRRLHTLLPSLLQAIAGGDAEAQALGRVLHVIELIGGRTVYLALLNENAVARQRLVELCTHSQFLTDQIAAFPLLLDELLDERLFETTPTRAEFEQDLRARMAGAGADDPERQVDLLREFQRAAVFRVAVPDLTGRLPLMKVSDRLTDIAEMIVAEALSLSWDPVVARHGVPRCGADQASLHDAGLIVVAYGKFGGIELGYGSDLDLVFLHDSAGECPADDGPADRRQRRVLPAAGAAARARAHGALERGPTLRGGHAAAAERERRAAGAEHRGLRRLPAQRCVDLGTPGAAAGAVRGRRARAARALRGAAPRHPALWRAPRHAARGRPRDARADACRVVAVRPGPVRPQAGRRRHHRHRVPRAVLDAALVRAPCGAGHVLGQHPPARKPRVDRPGFAAGRGCADRRLSSLPAAHAPPVT